jgi:NAD(P)-dependent dehydrogenase (short-subunit alcohol dehydrogenase family)
MSMKRLQGKTAVITGSTRGIGNGIALGFAREGANVVVSGTNADLCKEVADRIVRDGGIAVGVPCDISKVENIGRLYDKALERFGAVDISVNNAGITLFKDFLETDYASARKVWDVNIAGTYFCAQRAAREMVKRGAGGKIINMSSICAETGSPNLSVYAPTKAAISMMTKCMAIELAKHRINVNAIGAGVILTDINREHLSDPKNEEYWYSKIPWGRVGRPQDLVGAAIFLATDESEYVTGTTLFVDGGFIIE